MSILVTGNNFLAEDIMVNGRCFHRFRKRGKQTIEFRATNLIEKIDHIIYIEARDETRLDAFLPYLIKVRSNGTKLRTFVRRLNGIFTPQNATADELVQFFDLVAPEYEAIIDPSVNRRVYRHLMAYVLDKLTDKVDSLKVLDYGIGTGLILDTVTKLFGKFPIELYGVDFSQKMLDICQRKTRIDKIKQLMKCTYSKAPFHANFFDAVLASFVVHYFIDEAPFHEIWRLLRPGGILAFNLHKPENNYQQYIQMLLCEKGLRFTDVTIKNIRIKNENEEKVSRSIPMVFARKPLSLL